MLSPKNLLACLVGGAIGAGGILQGLHWKATRAPVDRSQLESQLRTAGEEIEMLRRENESLRALAEGGAGKLSVPREFIERRNPPPPRSRTPSQRATPSLPTTGKR